MSPLPQALTPEALLDGPRGRRLCLEVASLAASKAAPGPQGTDFGHARFYAAYDLDPGRGQSVVLVGPGVDMAQPRPTAAEVAAVLDQVPLSIPAGDGLLQALAATASNARYWQEPDGDDHLAATPEMRRSLHRFAVAMLESPHAAWWWAPMAADGQWAVAFIEEPPRPVSGLRPADPAANWSGN